MFGATCIATAGFRSKMDPCPVDLWAAHLINHYQQRLLRIKNITHKGMCDIVFEHVGKATCN